jgi:hypothetical protein
MGVRGIMGGMGIMGEGVGREGALGREVAFF